MLKKAVFFFMAFTLVIVSGTVWADEVGEIKHLCLALDQNIEGASVLSYDLSFFYLGHDHYLISGHITATHATHGTTIKRAITGAAIVDGQNMEINLQETDISDKPFTEEVEGLNVSELHMLVDKDTFGGTFQLLNTNYSTEGGENPELSQNFLSGTVALTDCQ
jgi:hypothetical protein